MNQGTATRSALPAGGRREQRRDGDDPEADNFTAVAR
jgi:hypothetical protein